MSSPKPDPRPWLATICGAMAASVALVALAAYLLAPSFAGEPPGSLVLWTLVAVAIASLVAATVLERVLAERPSPTGDPQPVVAARAKLVGFALREACGLIGGVLTFLTGDRLFAVTLAGFALLAMALTWPSPSEGSTTPR